MDLVAAINKDNVLAAIQEDRTGQIWANFKKLFFT